MSTIDLRDVAYALGQEARKKKGERSLNAAIDEALGALVACCASYSREELEASWVDGWYDADIDEGDKE